MQFAIGLSLLLVGADLELPPADVCERRFEIAGVHLAEMEAAYKVAGSFAMQQRYEQAKRSYQAWEMARYLRSGYVNGEFSFGSDAWIGDPTARRILGRE